MTLKGKYVRPFLVAVALSSALAACGGPDDSSMESVGLAYAEAVAEGNAQEVCRLTAPSNNQYGSVSGECEIVFSTEREAMTAEDKAKFESFHLASIIDGEPGGASATFAAGDETFHYQLVNVDGRWRIGSFQGLTEPENTTEK